MGTSLPKTCQPEGVVCGEAWCGGEGLSQLGMVGMWTIPSWANPSQVGSHPLSTREGGSALPGWLLVPVVTVIELFWQEGAESGVCCLLLYRSPFSYRGQQGFYGEELGKMDGKLERYGHPVIWKCFVFRARPWARQERAPCPCLHPMNQKAGGS